MTTCGRARSAFRKTATVIARPTLRLCIFGVIASCGGTPALLNGSSVCVDITDSGPQAVLTGGGISISIPLMMAKDAGMHD